MRNKIVLLLMLTTIIVALVFLQKNIQKTQSLLTSATPATTPLETSLNTMDSPDGSMTLTLEKKETSYSLAMVSKLDGKQTQIFVYSNNLEVPFNTWSPDNIFVFLKEKKSNFDDYLVFQSSGVMFANNSYFISIRELFTKNVPNYSIEEVTGWAAPNLLIVNTKSNESGQKVSFWFDVPSQSFIQLGTYFK